MQRIVHYLKEEKNSYMEIFIDLIPNVGLKDITFGMNRNGVRKKIKEIFGIEDFATRDKYTECYFDNSLQFSYEKDDTLSFIETASPPPIFVSILGIRTWEIAGDELLRLLCEKDSIDMDISEGGLNPIFQKTHIALYDLSSDHDFIEKHMIPKWDAIGIGDDRYYRSIRAIYNK